MRALAPPATDNGGCASTGRLTARGLYDASMPACDRKDGRCASSSLLGRRRSRPLGAGFANVCPRSSAATEHTNVPRIFETCRGCHGVSVSRVSSLPLDLRSSTIQISDGGKGRQKGRVGHASARRTQDARPKTNRQSIQSTLDARAPSADLCASATHSRQTRHRHAARVPHIARVPASQPKPEMRLPW
jgi:hypothetical protein